MNIKTASMIGLLHFLLLYVIVIYWHSILPPKTDPLPVQTTLAPLPTLSPTTPNPVQPTTALEQKTGPTGIPTVTPPPNPTSPPPNDRCIITLRGSQYDITVFRTVHSGGDIFQCGTDMTAQFDSRHGDREFQILQQYKL
jgi:hypothetical protein